MSLGFLTNVDSLRQAAGFLEKISLGVGGSLVYQGIVDLKNQGPLGSTEVLLGIAVAGGLFICAMAVTGYCYHRRTQNET